MDYKEINNVRKLRGWLKDASSNQVQEVITKLETIYLEKQEAEEKAAIQAKEEEATILRLRQEVIGSGVNLEKMIEALSKEKATRKQRKTSKPSPEDKTQSNSESPQP
ncbi:hypothetical protein [Vibrio europaeus]|uniref:H-NS family histone-like protein n=1 Tax=Vibrio europaeus TaxID=300876 RepID=UPI00233F780D|nr:hypothetical protein [Vibrio europaeus]MDC5711144.1 hypothetical protein [Vibrio europaeus]MDC5713173.1 hypothetical protein [Vibrio europaeus]